MTSQKLAAGKPFPELNLNLLSGQKTSISQPSDKFDWKLVVIYRGRHCPLCTRYLAELNDLLDGFNKLGVDVVAVSSDNKKKAVEHLEKINPRYDVAYGLSVEQMLELGLYVSSPQNGTNVDAAFSEPGLFVIDENQNLKLVDISNVPFARPDLQSILNGLRFFRGMTEPVPANGSYAA